MSKYTDDDICTDEIDNINVEDEDFQDIPTSQPNFNKPVPKQRKKGKQIDPSAISSAKQIPDAYIEETDNGPIVIIGNNSYPITSFNPRIIKEIQQREQYMEDQDQYQDTGGYQQQPYYPPQQHQQYLSNPYEHVPRGHGPLGPQYEPRLSREEYERLMYERERNLRKQAGNEKLIDLTDRNLGSDDGTSHSRKKPDLNQSMLTPLITGWKKSSVVLVLLILFFNAYSDTLFSKIPYLSNPYILLLTKVILVTVINHIIQAYFV